MNLATSISYVLPFSYSSYSTSSSVSLRGFVTVFFLKVCEVYRLHRETYHLALDFVDRYLATQSDLPKQQLQLIGNNLNWIVLFL